MVRHVLIAVAICAAAAVLETICAGTDVTQRFYELRMPDNSPPMWGWVVIAVYYYAMCWFVLLRTFRREPGTFGRRAVFALVIALLIANALWNLAFFRSGLLWVAFAVYVAYLPLAGGLFIAAWRFDRPAACAVAPYLVYLPYVASWTYGVWHLNGAA